MKKIRILSEITKSRCTLETPAFCMETAASITVHAYKEKEPVSAAGEMWSAFGRQAAESAPPLPSVQAISV